MKHRLGLQLIMLFVTMLIGIFALTVNTVQKSLENIVGKAVKLQHISMDAHIRNQITTELKQQAKAIDNDLASVARLVVATGKQMGVYLDHEAFFGQSNEHGSEPLRYSKEKNFFHSGKETELSIIYLGATPPSPKMQRRINAVSHIDTLLHINKEQTPFAVANWITLADGLVRYYPNIDLGNILPSYKEYDIRDDIYYTVVTPENDPGRELRWTPVYQDSAGQGMMTSAVMPIYKKNSVFMGVTGMDITLNGITKHFFKARTNGFDFLLDSEGHILGMPWEKTSLLGMKTKQQKAFRTGEVLKYRVTDSPNLELSKIVVAFMQDKKTGVHSLKLGGEDYFIGLTQLPSTHWIVGQLVKKASVFAPIIATGTALAKAQTYILKYIFWFGMTILVIGIGLMAWFIHVRFTLRLNAIAETAKNIEQGDITARTMVSGKDEISILAKAFNHMVERLDQFQHGLKNLVDARTEELAKTRDQAIAASKSKSDFLSMMSHEIRTPMNAIMGMTHLTLQTDLSPKQKDYLGKANAAAHLLLGIINDILDFSKIEAGKMEIEMVRFDLEDVLNNLSTMTGIRAHEKGLEIYFSLDAHVPHALMGDPLRLGQVLLNLTNNAIKFTEHGEITVRIQAVSTPLNPDEDQIMLELSVEDTGIGLSEKQISKLFQSFSQADTSTTRKYGGTGLGLAISKQLVKLMGGNIQVESEQGKGSRFIFTAIFGLQEQGQTEEFHTPDKLEGMRVLVVDDSAASRRIMKYYMEGFSFQVDTAISGEDALNILEKTNKTYRLVLMDWKMPGMNGIETTRRIRELPNLRCIPTIIMVTAYGKEEVMQQAQDAVLDGFLIKPVGQSVLFETLMSTFGYTIRRKPSVAKPRIQAKELETIKGAHILVVEDNAINQQIAREVLQQAGLKVTLANNGKEGVQKVREEAFDAVLMDLQMPEMDGYEATRIIRQDARFDDLPIIAMTAHAMVEEKEKCLAIGMNGHTPKPIDLQHLFDLLHEWIKPGEREPVQTRNEPMDANILPDTVSGIDVAACLKNIGGNKTLLKSLLLDFHQEFADTSTQIRSLLDQGDVQAAEHLAHNIKGTSGNLSAMVLYDTATRLDEALRQNDSDALPRLLDVFEAKLNEVMEAIAGLKQDDSPADGAGQPLVS